MPAVSVIVPCYNEQATIRLLLEAVYGQTSHRDQMEVVIADGLSTDDTRAEIDAFCATRPGLVVRVIENKARSIPAGLDFAIQAAAGNFIVRLDAHSAPNPTYVERCVQALNAGQGDNVGGVWEISPANPSPTARAIAAAAAHPLGVGDAQYRYSGRAQYVDTVPFGAFKRSLIERIGGFDESLLTNEDYEFNVRVRQNQGKVWLDPAIRSTYFARANLGALARQYWRYGYWKAQMLRRYPDTLRWRQAIPPVFVLSLLVLTPLALFLPAVRVLLGLELVVYILALFAAAALQARKRRDLALLWGMPLAIATMHCAWGSALLWSLTRSIFSAKKLP